MSKKFIKVPKDEKERILFALSLAESISGRPVSKQEVVKVFNDKDIELDDKIRREIKQRFPSIDL